MCQAFLISFQTVIFIQVFACVAIALKIIGFLCIPLKSVEIWAGSGQIQRHIMKAGEKDRGKAEAVYLYGRMANRLRYVLSFLSYMTLLVEIRLSHQAKGVEKTLDAYSLTHLFRQDVRCTNLLIHMQQLPK